MSFAQLKVDRESRRILRRVQAHLLKSHIGMGAQHETAGLMEVVYHPHNANRTLNYSTPRQRTAWVSGGQVLQGLDYLRQRDRTARVQYIEGLFPPPFAGTLRELGLTLESETPLMVHMRDGFGGRTAPTLAEPTRPEGITLEEVTDHRGAEHWWYVWRNAHYDVYTLGVEPLFVGRTLASVAMGEHTDFIAYQRGFPVGVARLTLHDDSAHIVAIALMRESRTAAMQLYMQHVALNAALERGCSLVFAPSDDDDERRIRRRQLGFVDLGAIVCYAEKPDEPVRGSDDRLDQPILDF